MTVSSRVGTLCASLLAVAAFSFSTTAHAQSPTAGNAPSKWPYAFPLFGDKVSEQGIKMPLPFGIGLNYAYANQPIEISRIAVAVNDSEYVDLSELIKFDELSSTAHVMNLRADLWLLPFMNVYGMGNYIVESQTSVSISEPFAFDAGATQSGVGGGFGMTFAGGIWGLFATLDLNWSWNKMENLNDPVGTFLLTPRIGQNLGKLGGVEFILWVGAMRQRIASETKGSIRLREAVGGAADGSFQDDLQAWYDGLPPGQQAIVSGIVGRIEGERDPVIHYDLDKAVAYPWNMLVGGEIGLSDAWRVRVEAGFIHRTQFLLGLNYRFGGFLGPGSSP
jgi:hypothetical protein